MYRFVLPSEHLHQEHLKIVHACFGTEEFTTFCGLRKHRSIFAPSDTGASSSLVERFRQMFNGDWSSKVWQHFCCSPSARPGDARRPCCASQADAQRKMELIFGEFSEECLWDRIGNSTKKWCETPRVSGPLGFLSSVHNTLPQAVVSGWGRSVGDGHDGDDVVVRADDDPRVKTSKRQGQSAKLFRDARSKHALLRACVVYRPIRGLVSEFFQVECEATLKAAGQACADLLKELRTRRGVQVEGTLLGRIVREGGKMEETKLNIEKLFESDSVLSDASLFAGDTNYLTENRALLLKARSSYEHRIVEPLADEGSFFQLVRLAEAQTDENRERIGSGCMSKNSCCCDVFVRRVRTRTQNRWQPILEEPACHKGILWLADSSPVITIVNCELLHAAFNNMLIGVWWKTSIEQMIAVRS